MNEFEVRIVARINLLPSAIEAGISLANGSRPNVFVCGSHYPSIISRTVRPLVDGFLEAEMKILKKDETDLAINVGSEFKLKDGPTINIADAIVLEIFP